MRENWTPNQLAKREAIIDAACKVLLTGGVAACTARAVAEMSPLTTSALHYYFEDIDEIMDPAFRRVMDRFVERITEAAANEPDPVDALWAAAAMYLRQGSGRRAKRARRAPMLWFDYQAESMRKGDLKTVQELSARGTEMFRTFVAAVGISDVAVRTEVLQCALLGAAIREAFSARDTAVILGEIAQTLDLPPSSKFCAAPVAV